MFEQIFGEDVTVIHPHPHPLAMKVVTPKNVEIFKKFGNVRVEDWDDRVSGLTWHEKVSRGNFPEANYYKQSAEFGSTAVPASSAAMAVVRCHTTSTGELVLLHNDWLPSPV